MAQQDQTDQPRAPRLLRGECFWRETLGSPRLVVAPMVDASELAWRLLSRRHGAHLCYTPMLHSSVFIRDPRYRVEALASTPEDRPLIVQFCANNTAVLLEAALQAEPYCDAVDINLGCPQAIARRGRYGSFLQDDWDLLKDMVSTLNARLAVPVTCKIRVFADVARTVEYARMLEAAGCQMLTVHGRTREQKGPLTGLANWAHIKAVVENVKIPVFANGNIQYLQDIERCILETGAKGVMSAEGNLYNPALFEGVNPPCWELALEYLDLADAFPCPTSFVRTHLFKMMHHLLSMPENAAERQEIAKGQCLADFRLTVKKLRDRFLPYHEGQKEYSNIESETYDLRLPPWLCQPYVRITPEEHLRKLAEKQNKPEALVQNEVEDGEKRSYENSVETLPVQLSKKKLKRLEHSRREKLYPHGRRAQEKCTSCANPLGQKCGFRLCKACCRKACFNEKKDCPGHRILTRTRYEKLLQYQAMEAAAVAIAVPLEPSKDPNNDVHIPFSAVEVTQSSPLTSCKEQSAISFVQSEDSTKVAEKSESFQSIQSNFKGSIISPDDNACVSV